MNKTILKFLVVFCLPFFALAQTSNRDLNIEKWTFRKKGNGNWANANIPGTVHTDLLQNNSIPDPFFGDNEKQLQWIENEDWEYVTTFSVSKKELLQQHIELQFDGLDTYAKVYLNNTLILEADNMFRTWKIDLKKYIKEGKNELYVVFESAVKKGKEEAKKLSYTLPGEEKVFTRKAQYQYGWDWGPRFVTCGIWKNVKLNFWNAAEISNVKYEQNLLTDSLAVISFITTINCSKAGIYHLKINDKTHSYLLSKGQNKLQLKYEIKNPKRWWSSGLGEAYLYLFSISLHKNKDILDSEKLNIGLRTIELIQEKDKFGKSFYFKLNGIPVFMKGANYIPPDSFLPRATDEVYKNLVKNAVDSNMNMLRVWGGGVYANDAFYDACDKNGILVWQDFMFACAMYPGDNHFIENVKNEVIDNVDRLQNHPSVALWCGNNENDEGWKNWGWQKQYKYSQSDSTKIWNDYKKLFHEVIPQTLDSLLSKDKNIYWPSSPSIGWGKKESLTEGDSHYWGVWWGMEPFEIYKQKVGRFMSEYGFQGMPNLNTFWKFTNVEDLNLTSAAVKNHQKHATGYQTIQTYMEREYKVPTKFEDYIYVSQLLQAEGMKTAIEAHRRAKPYCMGSLYWQFNDCWPVTSWSSVDYSGTWKALQYQVKRSFENLLVSVNEEDNQYKIYIINDELKSKKGQLQMELFDFCGEKLWNKNLDIEVKENSSQVYFTIDKKEFKDFNPKQIVLCAKFIVPNETEKRSLFYFVKPKDLELLEPKIEFMVIVDPLKKGERQIGITTDVLSKNIFICPDFDVNFSDNYFDLLPNETKIINYSRMPSMIELKSLFGTIQ
ncbi:MAG: glycoside hydrolase family 2 protein [Bacteroidota bacterium]